MRSFASDNNSSVHPLVMDAVIKANDNHAVGYGDDPWTAAATAKIREVFGEMASPFFVFNGTGANAVALQAVTRPFNSILCAETAHINVDECGAPARMTGCAIVTIPAPDGKLTPELIKPRLHNFGVCHHSQPKAVYISQVSELGTIYTIEEVKAIADLLHSYDMYLHMDGARLANACAYLNQMFSRNGIGSSSCYQFRGNSPHDIRIAGFTDSGNFTVFYSDIRFDHPQYRVDNRYISND